MDIRSMQKENLNSSYVKTKVGILPKDWDVKKLEDIAHITMGQSPKSENYNNNRDGLPLIQGNADCENRKTKPRNWTTQITKTCDIDDIIMTVRAPVGTVSKSLHKACIGRGVCSIKSKQNQTFLYYLLLMYETKWERLSQGSTFKSINSNDIKKIDIPIPDQKEQDKIASILSTWDKAIELKEKLIEQKKEQKKGLMQKLLTGEVRLPGFDEDWVEVKLGDVLEERRETGFNDLELLAITSSRGVVKRTEVDIKDNSSADKSRYKRILPNDIGYNTMRMWQGVSGISRYEGIVSPAYTILKPTKKVDSLFMSYLFKVPKIIDLFRRYSQGLVSDTLNLKYSNFKGIKVVIPADIDEQKEISNILNTQDKEIELLEKQKQFLSEQKKGLMQLLLTGKVRVKV